MKNFVLIFILAIGFASCKKDKTPIPAEGETNLIYYYDKIQDGNLSVFAYDGVVEKNLVNDNTHDYWWIKVSPDKTKFLCYRSPKNAGLNSFTVSDLMVFNMDGTNGHVIIPAGGNGWELQAHAKWSPDGTKILGTAKCKDATINDQVMRGRIVVFNADGTNPVVVTKFLYDIADPAWSHDGSKMVYVAPSDLSDAGNPEKAEIYQATLNYTTMELENPIRLSFDDKYCYDPTWSPDGNWIAYSKGAFVNLFWTENHDIYKCRPDGSEDVLVLHDGKVNGVPSWTPNGDRLIFHVLGLNGPHPFSLFSCSVNGNDKKMILSSANAKRSTISAVLK